MHEVVNGLNTGETSARAPVFVAGQVRRWEKVLDPPNNVKGVWFH